MKTLTIVNILLLAGISGLLVRMDRSSAAQEDSTGDNGGEDEGSELDTFLRHAMPGKEHSLLNRMAGSWKTATRYWLKPGGPPAEARGTSERRWILGRRFLREEFDGGVLALPFQGTALYGYDAFSKRYISVWADTMSTSMMVSQGTYQKTDDLVSFETRYGDPWTGTKKKCRGVTRFAGEDKHLLELYVADSSSEEYKMLEITYTRNAEKTTGDSPRRHAGTE